MLVYLLVGSASHRAAAATRDTFPYRAPPPSHTSHRTRRGRCWWCWRGTWSRISWAETCCICPRIAPWRARISRCIPRGSPGIRQRIRRRTSGDATRGIFLGNKTKLSPFPDSWKKYCKFGILSCSSIQFMHCTVQRHILRDRRPSTAACRPGLLVDGDIKDRHFPSPAGTCTGSFSGFCLSLGYRIPCGLFTPGSFYHVVFANFLVFKDLAKWRDFHFSRIFPRLLTFELRVLSRSVDKSEIRG